MNPYLDTIQHNTTITNNQIKKVIEIINNIKEFFYYKKKFLSLLLINDNQELDNISSMDIICRGYPPIYDPNFRQRGLNGDVVSNLKELYDCAHLMKPTFDNSLQRISDSLGLECRQEDVGSGMYTTGEVGLVLCSFKDLDKASDDVMKRYCHIDPGPPESWLYDVVTATFICESQEQICQVCDAIQVRL